MKKLTKAEEELMQILWKLERGFIKDILAQFPDSTQRPKQSTVSTVLKILEQKGFVAHQTYGKAHQYYPKVSKDTYAKFYFGSFLGKYFEGSFQQLLSFFHKEGEIKLEELDQLLDELKDDQNPSA